MILVVSQFSVKKMSAMMMMMMAMQRIITEAGLSAEDCSQVYTHPSWCREGATFSQQHKYPLKNIARSNVIGWWQPLKEGYQEEEQTVEGGWNRCPAVASFTNQQIRWLETPSLPSKSLNQIVKLLLSGVFLENLDEFPQGRIGEEEAFLSPVRWRGCD